MRMLFLNRARWLELTVLTIIRARYSLIAQTNKKLSAGKFCAAGGILFAEFSEPVPFLPEEIKLLNLQCVVHFLPVQVRGNFYPMGLGVRASPQ